MEKPPPIKDLARDLADPKCPIGRRMRTVFYLKLHGGKDAISALEGGLISDSVLLNHEICYVLGQMQDPLAVPVLNKVLVDEKAHPVVRHEAAEALGAIGIEESLELLRKYAKSPVTEVAETCELAIDSVLHQLEQKKKAASESKTTKGTQSKYLSVDPAPAEKDETDVTKLQTTLNDTKKRLFDRYRAMFALRDLGTKESVEALATAFGDKSAIVRHEIAYVMGQMRHVAAVPHLKKVLEDAAEHSMVRHEAAEALGSISNSESVEILNGYKADKQRIVSESCKVALDIAEDWGAETTTTADE
uniref:Deoxyhypusine hydroxylase n=1 Tax=Lotharella oceanica TaxID=641309 RepID=A0A7S2XB05_9EUKA